MFNLRQLDSMPNMYRHILLAITPYPGDRFYDDRNLCSYMSTGLLQLTSSLLYIHFKMPYLFFQLSIMFWSFPRSMPFMLWFI
jgi:hypothetical protein